ncbi:hypothetical protein AGLY_011582 [Aphis glycines]|uniref:SWIM-type domain-containing protein n=1 Tax=Aphis glycines TaxID=307491 RepID=A0A6G0TCV0_APHGL|nr:hypothetical protein AGLY_011582 [Aphis glycines]
MLMATLRTKRDHVATECFSKTPSFINNLTADEKKCTVISTDKETESATIQSSEGVLLTNPIKCSCSFVTSMCLPCHHILKLRQIYNISLYDPNLYAERWTRKYYAKVCRVISTDHSISEEVLEIEEDNSIQIDHHNLEDTLPSLPPRVPKRGRSKGKDKTVIGVPKKRKLRTNLLPFKKLPTDIRQYEILCWFVHDTITKSAIYQNKIIDEDVETILEKVSNAFLDKAIAINEINRDEKSSSI